MHIQKHLKPGAYIVGPLTLLQLEEVIKAIGSMQLVLSYDHVITKIEFILSFSSVPSGAYCLIDKCFPLPFDYQQGLCFLFFR